MRLLTVDASTRLLNTYSILLMLQSQVKRPALEHIIVQRSTHCSATSPQQYDLIQSQRLLCMSGSQIAATTMDIPRPLLQPVPAVTSSPSIAKKRSVIVLASLIGTAKHLPKSQLPLGVPAEGDAERTRSHPASTVTNYTGLLR